MKIPSTDLWKLVKTLTTAEKTYFKRNFTTLAKKDELIYLKLFNKIASQKEYDEEDLINNLKGKITSKNISSQKTYLYKQISTALISYHQSKNAEQDIYQQILLIRLYRSKGLLDMAHKSWQKAMSVARNEDAYSMMPIIKAEYEKMALFNSEHSHTKKSYSLFRNYNSSYKGFICILHLRDLYAEILLLKAKAHFDFGPLHANRIKKIEDGLKAINIAETEKSFWIKHYLFICKATLHYLNNKPEDALILLQKNYALWKGFPKMINSNAEFFIEVMNMINYAGIAIGNFDYVKKVFEDPVNEYIIGSTNIATFKTIQWLAHSKIYHKTASYNKVENLVDVMQKQYNNWVPSLNSELNRTLHVSMSISCFVLEKYNDAYYYCKRSLDIYRKNVREESSAFAHMFLLLITFELNNIKLFDAAQKNTHSYFYKKRNQHHFEKVMCNSLGKSFYAVGYESKRKFYETSLSELENMSKNNIQKANFNIFNYPRWLQSKIEKISYREYVEKVVAEEYGKV